jgi:predicted DNA-binding transcriptional regulator AlpA
MTPVDSTRYFGVPIRRRPLTPGTEPGGKLPSKRRWFTCIRSRPVSKIPTSQAIPPRCLSVNEAAKYLSISRNTFLKLVRLGVAPQPLNIPETNRVLYDRVQLDAAIEARAMRHGAM